MNYFYVFVGGGIGSILRFLVQKLMPASTDFPIGTLIANVASCFLFGLVVGIFAKGQLTDAQKLFMTTGLCGGFSTFSAFSAESFLLLEGGNYGYFLLNIIGSVLLCMFAYYFGAKCF